MIKEELFAKIDQLTIDQSKYCAFREYLRSFVGEPRCKKGCIEFAKEIYNLPQIAGLDQFAMSLVVGKTRQNSYATEAFVMNHQITTGYNDSLITARVEILQDISDYIVEFSGKVEDTKFEDVYERQVYLRRAVARLITVLTGNRVDVIKVEDWSEVQPYDHINYLGESLEELTSYFNDKKRIVDWSDNWGSWLSLERENTLLSLRNFIDYLDSYLKY